MNKLFFEPVKSSQLKARAYDAPTSTLYIKFRSYGKVYSYSPVSQEQYDEFRDAKSAGSHFHKNFKMNSKLIIKPQE